MQYVLVDLRSVSVAKHALLTPLDCQSQTSYRKFGYQLTIEKASASH